MPSRLYSWSRWFEKKGFVVRKGVDYQCSHSSMSQQIRNAASRRGLAVTLEEIEDRIVVVILGRRRQHVGR